MKTDKPSPGPALIRSMKQLCDALKNSTVDKFKQTMVRPSTGTRIVIDPKEPRNG